MTDYDDITEWIEPFRPAALPVLVLRATALVFLGLAAGMFLASCSPRAFDSINKLAPAPPYMGERHSGLDRAEYLRVEESLEK